MDYVLENDPRYRDLITEKNEEGERVSFASMPQRSREGVPTEHRLRMEKLIRDLTSSYEDVLTIHVESSLEAQKLSIYALGDFEKYKAAANRAARIKEGINHSIYSQSPDFPPASLR